MQKGLMGLYRQRVGWGKGPKLVMPSDQEFFAVIQSGAARRPLPPLARQAESDGTGPSELEQPERQRAVAVTNSPASE